VPNGLIVQMTNLSREWARAVVDVPLPAGVDVLQANELLRRVGRRRSRMRSCGRCCSRNRL